MEWKYFMNDNFDPKLLRAGNDNLFQSNLFIKYLFTLIECKSMLS